MELTEHQKEIFDKIIIDLDDRKTCLLTGFAGTGKTFLTSKIVKYFNDQNVSVKVVSPTHKALSVLNDTLKESNLELEYSHSTLAMLLNYKPSKYSNNPENPDFIFDIEQDVRFPEILIIDECSMIKDDMLQELISKAKEFNTGMLFIGDIAQLPPVGEQVSPVFSKINNIHSLSEVIRTKKEDIALLNSVLRSEEYEMIFNWFESENIKIVKREDYDYSDDVILAFKNETVAYHNKKAKELLNPSEEYISNGDKVMLYMNTDSYSNSTIGTVKKIKDGECFTKIKIEVKGSTRGSIDLLNPKGYNKFISEYKSLFKQKLFKSIIALKKINLIYENIQANICSYIPVINKSIDLAYAITVHKSQGSTFDSIAVDIRDALISKDCQKLLYTAVSRARNHITLII